MGDRGKVRSLPWSFKSIIGNVQRKQLGVRVTRPSQFVWGKGAWCNCTDPGHARVGTYGIGVVFPRLTDGLFQSRHLSLLLLLCQRRTVPRCVPLFSGGAPSPLLPAVTAGLAGGHPSGVTSQCSPFRILGLTCLWAQDISLPT